MPTYPATAYEPLGNYSNAVVTSGALIHLSGQVAARGTAGEDAPSDPEVQASQILDRIEAILRDLGRALEDLVVLRVYVVSAAAADGWRRARDARLRAPYPASTLVQVGALGKPEWLLEVEATIDASGLAQ